MKYFFLSFLCPLLFWGEVNSGTEEEALFLNRIADFWEEGEYQIAKEQIHEFLALYPGSRFYDTLSSALGDLFLREKNYEKAFEYYAKIKEEEILERIFQRKIQCMYALGEHENLAKECEAYLEKNHSQDIQIVYYLATALYHQISSNPSEELVQKALPHFETLFASHLKQEVAAAFAHLLCLAKNFPKAASIYLDLAQETGSEEMLFQAAIIQAEYDKELSLKTFSSIQNSKPESTYNSLVLSFDLQKYDEILSSKESYLQILSPEQIPIAHLFFGTSLFALGRYEEASSEINEFIASANGPSDSLHSALITLINASIHLKDLAALDTSIEKMHSFYPEDVAIVNGKFSKALLLREKNSLLEAKEILASLPQKAEVLLELTHLCNQLQLWEEARHDALLFLSKFPEDPSFDLAKKYLIFASTEIATASLEGKKQLIEDLKTWGDASSKYLLAKTLFSLQQYEDALSLLLKIEGENEADVYFLTALCYRDGFQDLPQFCHFGEKVFTVDHPSIEEGPLHSALFNTYLELSKTDPQLISKAKDHLYSSYLAKMSLTVDNLLWLSDRFLEEGNQEIAIAILENVKEEKAHFLLSKLYAENGRYQDAATLLENIENPEARLLLGEMYVSLGKKDEAKQLFSKLSRDSASLKTYVGASASYQKAKLELEDEGQKDQVLTQLKNLVLQKNIAYEPIYLEASLDYIALQSQRHLEDFEKKLQLLEKTKRDFESTETLLSKDYHAMRDVLEKQNHIYLSYMDFFEAEILDVKSKIEKDPAKQKALQVKAENLLLKIIEDKAHPALVARANQCLKS